MNFDINNLRELVKTGEYLEEYFDDVQVRNQWLYEIDNFVNGTDRDREIKQFTKKIRTFTNNRFGKDSFNSIMGFLRHSYNNYQPQNHAVNNINHLVSNLQNVFIVHGHDSQLIEDVKQCIHELNLNPIVLHEQVNQGRTIIEKLERYLTNCKCAIILYTSCDIGKAVSEDEFSPRARQNVVYEHGLFQGALSRKRVILLRKGNTIIPGDNDGIVYTSVDSLDWKEKLKVEIQAIDEPSITGDSSHSKTQKGNGNFDIPPINTESKNLAVSEEVTHAEKQLLTLLLDSQDSPNDRCSAHFLKQKMRDIGVSGTEYSFVIRKLLSRIFLTSSEETDINGQPFTLYSISETGNKWIESNAAEMINYGSSLMPLPF